MIAELLNRQDFKRVVDILPFLTKKYPSERLLSAKKGNSWISFSTADVEAMSTKLAAGLIALGVEHQEVVILAGYNCCEWTITDFAIQKAGAVSIPLYHNLSQEDYKYILNQAGVRYIFCATKALHDNLSEALRENGQTAELFCFEEHHTVRHWQEVFKMANEASTHQVSVRLAATGLDHLCTILYTSGTSGLPNGVMLSHGNIINNLLGVSSYFPLHVGQRYMSFLPISHAYERTVGYLMMMFGLEIWFAQGIEQVGENIKEIKPHVFTTVPRLIEKVYDRILKRGRDSKGIKRILFFWALLLAMRFRPGKERSAWYNAQLWLARKLVFSKWKAGLGGELDLIISGGAALQERLARIFWGAGFHVIEGYGLSEHAPIVSFNRYDEVNCRTGTVGMLVDTVEIRFEEDGELLVKSPSVFKGYYKNPELTEKTLTHDGWLRTGDIFELVEGRFLKIRDRKKDLFKTSGGMYIAPTAIELTLKECTLFEQVMVIGENRKFPTAIMTINWQNLKDWCGVHGIAWTSDAEMLAHPEVQQKIDREVAQRNEKLTGYKKIKKYAVLPDNWTIESGEMTVTMKIKRRIVLQKYAKVIEAMYAEN